MSRLIRLTVRLSLVLGCAVHVSAEAPPQLPGTKPLKLEGDIASHMIDGIDKFLMRKLAESEARRARRLNNEFILNREAVKKLPFHGHDLKTIIGVVDPRVPFDAPELVATTDRPALVARGVGFDVYAIRWPVLYDPQPDRKIVSIHGEGLLLLPRGKKPVGDVVAIPHCDHTPEQIVGLAPGLPPESQYARRLAEGGCRVVVPTLINRDDYIKNLTHREYIYRSAFELGRHIIGYEVQKVLAAIDWLDKTSQGRRLATMGYGDGAMIAMYAAALEQRIDLLSISGYLSTRERVWAEPIDRNVFGRLLRYGDYELAQDVQLIAEHAPSPTRTFNGGRGAPYEIVDVTKEQHKHIPWIRWGQFAILDVHKFTDDIPYVDPFTCRSDDVIIGLTSDNPVVGIPVPKRFKGFQELPALPDDVKPAKLPPLGQPPKWLTQPVDTKARHARQFNEMDRHNQALLRESEVKRAAFMKRLYDAVPRGIDAYNKVAADYRRVFREEVIGAHRFNTGSFNARSRLDAETDQWTRYEVVLDVFPDVIAYGLLIVPKDIKDGERRPVVVCQHGLEGRPQDVIGEKSHHYYKAFATTLAERGFVTFAPQNIYIFKDRFRVLQRKANPLGMTLFSIMVPQHQQITEWLKTQPFVDGKRIGFYGLSYGGKSAMRIPPLVDNYCLSICSADFNEWVWKNASTSTFAKRYTYANKGEYEIFEWDLGSTFNYAEMAALIAPRPFMVERGHDDGVAPDETVAYEYAKVRRLYAKLGIPDRTRIEYFNGPHAINGVGTFEFLHKHLDWPAPKRKE